MATGALPLNVSPELYSFVGRTPDIYFITECNQMKSPRPCPTGPQTITMHPVDAIAMCNLSTHRFYAQLLTFLHCLKRHLLTLCTVSVHRKSVWLSDDQLSLTYLNLNNDNYWKVFMFWERKIGICRLRENWNGTRHVAKRGNFPKATKTLYIWIYKHNSPYNCNFACQKHKNLLPQRLKKTYSLAKQKTYFAMRL